MNYKEYLAFLRNKTKKGSTYTNINGEVLPLSDYARGENMGRYKALCEQAIKFNENKAKYNNTIKVGNKNYPINYVIDKLLTGELICVYPKNKEQVKTNNWVDDLSNNLTTRFNKL